LIFSLRGLGRRDSARRDASDGMIPLKPEVPLSDEELKARTTPEARKEAQKLLARMAVKLYMAKLGIRDRAQAIRELVEGQHGSPF